jgi:SAM-dependent methyltransferase
MIRPAVKFLNTTGARLRQAKEIGLKALAEMRGGASKPSHYEWAYEAHARTRSAEDAVGRKSNWDLMGRIELAYLLQAGLEPNYTLLDFGCGTGRLAVRAIPYLQGGHYIGTDISETMLTNARSLIATQFESPRARITWLKQEDETFPVATHSVDIACAFSVFTHMEPEDMYRYLKSLRQVLKADGVFVFSCLPLSLAASREIFLKEAELPLEARWSRIRSFTCSTDLVESILELANWRTESWYPGDRPVVAVPGDPTLRALGQSVCVARPR